MRNRYLAIIGLLFTIGSLQAQTDTMYIMKQGVVIDKFNVKTEVDTLIFRKPKITYLTAGIETVAIPAGTFTMGSPTSEAKRDANEIQHSVTLSAFRMGKYEVTNQQFVEFLNAKRVGVDGIYKRGSYPTQKLLREATASYYALKFENGQWNTYSSYKNLPVTYVTWYGAMEYANYVGGSLPTEAQWEYACRAKTSGPFNTGSCITAAHANFDWTLGKYETCLTGSEDNPGIPMVVGSFPANAFGLYDMHGNVAEWCNDLWIDYTTAPQTNPTGGTSGTYRVVRGGDFAGYAAEMRSAIRDRLPEDASGGYTTGFRVVFNN